MSVGDTIKLITNAGNKNSKESIPRGRKENLYFLISEERNRQRSYRGESRQYPDDCGIWEGSIAKSHFVVEGDAFKSVSLRDGAYCTEHVVSKQRIYKKLEP